MEHAIETLSENTAHPLPIKQIHHHELRPGRNRVAMPTLETVQHDYLVAGTEQLFSDDRADVAGAARDEEFHRWPAGRERIDPISVGDITDPESRTP